jgi:signal peptidase I
LKLNPSKPVLNRIEDGELLLSSQALLELMVGVLAKGCRFRFRARGWSMNPFIRDGDIICVSPIQEKNPSVGEVVAYIQPTSGKLVVHRLVNRSGDNWVILGDNTLKASGEQVPIVNLIGRVTGIKRGGKNIWLGLGPERYLIALFSRTGTLLPLQMRVRQIYKRRLPRILR